MLTNCVNCGAPLSGGKCAYCGTEYDNTDIKATFGDYGQVGVLSVGGKEYECYIGGVKIAQLGYNAGRSLDGRLHLGDTRRKHTFTLIEV